MLDFEKCREIVDEVWGWEIVDEGDGEYYWRPADKNACYQNYAPMSQEMVIKEVCSWEGFGRTVEAMEKLGYFLIGGYGGEIVFVDIKDMGRPSFALHCEENSEDFRDATHLAALEAVKNANK